MADGSKPVGDGETEFGRILRFLERLDRGQTVLNGDFNGLYQTVLQLQRDVNFFTRRCEERGNLIREYMGQIREDGAVEPDAALEFLRQLECAGTPVRPPSSEHPKVCVDFDVDEPTNPEHDD